MPNNPSSADQSAIDTIVNSFFDLFTNTNQMQPDFSNIDSLCIPETIIIKKTGLLQDIYHLQSFIAPRQTILTDGTLTNFCEKEINSETIIYGHMAQRFSRYEKSGYLSGAFFKGAGHKLFQLIHTSDGWRISALVWEDDTI